MEEVRSDQATVVLCVGSQAQEHSESLEGWQTEVDYMVKARELHSMAV